MIIINQQLNSKLKNVIAEATQILLYGLYMSYDVHTVQFDLCHMYYCKYQACFLYVLLYVSGMNEWMNDLWCAMFESI